MTKTAKKDDRGFTLVELIIGVAIFAIVITPLLHALVVGANSTKKNRQYNDATIAAQNIAEDIAAADMATYLKNAAPRLDAKGNVLDYTIATKQQGGGESFDAKITIAPEKASIPVSGNMDAQLAMQEADADAAAQLQTELDAYQVTTTPALTRTMSLTVSDVSEGIFNITAEFIYTATIKYSDGENNRTLPFEASMKQSKNVSVASGADFCAYLFFSDVPDGIKLTSGDLKVYNNAGVVGSKNPDGVSFNLYLIDVSAKQSTGVHRVFYYPKKTASGVKTTMSLMTNLQKVSYRTFKPDDQVWMSSVEVPVGLAKTSTIERTFNITIDVFKNGELTQEGAEPVFTLKNTKLDYSVQ